MSLGVEVLQRKPDAFAVVGIDRRTEIILFVYGQNRHRKPPELFEVLLDVVFGHQQQHRFGVTVVETGQFIHGNDFRQQIARVISNTA